MSAHPNRSKRPDAAAANPTPEQIRAARLACDLTPKDAAALIYCTATAWAEWEAGTRRMHPASWTLWRMRVYRPDEVDELLREADEMIARLAARAARGGASG